MEVRRINMNEHFLEYVDKVKGVDCFEEHKGKSTI